MILEIFYEISMNLNYNFSQIIIIFTYEL